jgi:hypothetical protein
MRVDGGKLPVPVIFDAGAAVWTCTEEEAGATLDDLIRRNQVKVASRSD